MEMKFINILTLIGTITTLIGDAAYADAQMQPKFSSKFSSNIKRASPQNKQSAEDRVDFANGFPDGFTDGLPSFDFSGSMSATDKDAATADTENVGFVHGPPKGFPTLEELGGSFSNYGTQRDGGSASNRQYQPQQYYPQASQEAPYQSSNIPHRNGASSYQFRDDQRGESVPVNSDYLSGPGPSSVHNHPIHPPLMRHHPHNEPRPVPNKHRPHAPLKRPMHPHQHQRPEIAGSSGNSQYAPIEGRVPHHGPSHGEPNHHPHPHHHGKKPIVLKVSSKKTRPTKLPPPPPPFYAPSPDYQPSGGHQKRQNGGHSFGASNNYNQPMRYRRSTSDKDDSVKDSTKANSKDEKADLIADGSENTFWELTTSPFIIFDDYKDDENKTEATASSSDHVGHEQRFFPSFPAGSPYLGLGHYGGVPAARPPLFPGPTVNRSPSRYHPQFGPTNKYSQSLAPNRGPSGVYSAESHDQGDRYQDNNLLGSGNFQVERGGTFYEEDDGYHPGFHGGGGGGGAHHSNAEDDYYPNNGNGYRGDNFFQNFRDFADINPSRSFSHNIESYHSHFGPDEPNNKNRQPKNIQDKLPSEPVPVHQSLTSGNEDPMMATN